MTPNPSEHAWLKPTLIATALLGAALFWLYLAGGIFLLTQKRNFSDSTLLTLYQYWYWYGDSKAVQDRLFLAGVGALLLLASPFALLLRPGKRPSLFGDARFAKPKDIRKAGLLRNQGIIVGRYKQDYLMLAGSQHVLMSAPTRTGKGVGIVIPNLLAWPDSVVVLDIKQENHAITSGYRSKHGQPCFLFNPVAADYRTHRYNPLAYISDDPNFRIDDIQKLAYMLFPDTSGVDVIWTATPRTLFVGIVLSLLETPGKLITMGQVLRETLVDGDGSAYFSKMIQEREKAGAPLSGTCARALNSYISISAENTRAGIMTSFRSKLELWNNPLVDAATSANDFDLRDVRKKRMSIYLGVTPDNLERMGPLLNLFFQQLIDLNTRQLPEHNPALKYQCLLLADEFTAMGKINALSKGISYIAGYGLRMLPIIQSPSQLVEVYGKDAAQTFTTNHALQIVFPPKASELQTARDISEWLGYQTVKGVSQSKRKGLFAKESPSESQSDQRRALLLPQEITSLGNEKELVVTEGCPPIMAKKIRFFSDQFFMQRLRTISPLLAAKGKKTLTEAQFKAIVTTGELTAHIPRIDMEGHKRLIGETPMAAYENTSSATPEQAVTDDYMPKLAMLGLESFSVNFSGTEKTAIGNLDTVALNVYTEKLCNSAGLGTKSP